MSWPTKCRRAALVLFLWLFLSGYFLYYRQSPRKVVFARTLLNSRTRYPFIGSKSVNDTNHQNNSPTLSIDFSRHVTLAPLRNTTPYLDVSQFVSFHDTIYGGRRLGNQLFDFAAVVFVAELTGRRPVLISTKNVTMESVFVLNVERVQKLCPCYTVHETKSLSYDPNTEKEILKAGNKSILIKGYRQSWKYTMTIERRLRRLLVFNDEIRRFAEDFLQRNIPPGWKKAGFVRVGLHARRGDIVHRSRTGYSVPNVTYFEKAMKYFIEKYSFVQFIAMSDERKWTVKNIFIPDNISSSVSVNVTHSLGHSAGQDLALLSMCDHVIMSTGTFGWWGAWLAKGTTIYYENWPIPGTKLYKRFTREDFFPLSWISMGD